jgi:hydroxyacylglutathione hydrolase
MMSSDIFSLKLGLNSCYIIRGKNTIMVDGGMPDKLNVFRRRLKRLYIHPEEIKLIVLTHSHFDHSGSAEEISEFTGAKDTWGKITLPLLRPFFKRISFPEVKPDIIIKDEEYSLNEYGINGSVLHTPGHTQGSLSILLNTGEAFVGCMAHNGLPFRLNPGFPVYAQDMDILKQSWKLLISKGAKMIFPGHGNPFPVEVISRQLSL